MFASLHSGNAIDSKWKMRGYKLTYENHKSVPKKLTKLFVAYFFIWWGFVLGWSPIAGLILLNTWSRLRPLSIEWAHFSCLLGSHWILVGFVLGLFDIVASALACLLVLRSAVELLPILLKRVFIYVILIVPRVVFISVASAVVIFGAAPLKIRPIQWFLGEVRAFMNCLLVDLFFLKGVVTIETCRMLKGMLAVLVLLWHPLFSRNMVGLFLTELTLWKSQKPFL